MANYAITIYEITGYSAELGILGEHLKKPKKEYIKSGFDKEWLGNEVAAACVTAGLLKEEPDSESLDRFDHLMDHVDIDFRGEVYDLSVCDDQIQLYTITAWGSDHDPLRLILGALGLKNLTVRYWCTEPANGFYEYYDGFEKTETMYSIDYTGNKYGLETCYEDTEDIDYVREWALSLYPEHPELKSMSAKEIEGFINANEDEYVCAISEWEIGDPITPYSVEEILGFMTEDN